MLDINFIRENPEIVKNKIKDRGYNIDIHEFLQIDKKWRDLKVISDKLRSRRNEISKEINDARKNNKDAAKLLAEAKEVPQKLAEIEQEMNDLDKKRENILFLIPNMQHESSPIGGEEANKEVKRNGEIKKFDFEIKSHEQLLDNLGMLDMKRGAKITGSGFYVFRGDFAKFARALVQFMLDFHTKDGFEEINPPQLVNEKTMFGTGNLPKFEEDLYKTREGFYLIPTAEVPVTNLYADEVIEERNLPFKFVSFTQCYRTEAGRHGAETPGIFRLHEFEKVEMVYICKPEDSWKFHEEMTARAETLLEMLKLPYRRLLLATGDAGFASAKTYDLEVWSPYLNKYLETSSCSNCTDFQARRMNTKFIEAKTGDRKFVHTLNGSGLATPRLLIALIENYQNKDGSITIPEVLVPYMNGMKKLEKTRQN